MSVFRYLAGPLIGAIIGYFTNYIAVKMLFFPRQEIKIRGHRLPFTPGAIPKGKPRLAKAIGKVVGTTLITREDMSARLQSEEVVGKISASVMSLLSEGIGSDLEKAGVSEDTVTAAKDQLSSMVSEEIVREIGEIDFTGIIVEKGGGAVKEMVRGSMLELFINDDMIRSIAVPISVEMHTLIEKEGMAYVQPKVRERMDGFSQLSVIELCHRMDISAEVIRDTVESLIRQAMQAAIDMVMGQLHIAEMVEGKINDMSVEDLEKLVLTVMKNELNMIVNLGALIGFILGLLNVFVL